MARFHFITHWEITACTEEVYRIIKDSNRLCEWWPSVYLAVKTLKEGDPQGVGKIINLYTKGYLPYTLQWTFEVMHVIENKTITIKAYGDLVGSGTWTFLQQGNTCIVIYDWDIHFEKPFLSSFTWLLRPIFSFNHRWAMQKGLESLQLELRRKRGESNVPDAPKAVWVIG